MPTLFVFLLKVNLALLVFCAGYYAVLRRLTFYSLNRIYLVGAIVFASVYPEINLSGFWERHRQVVAPIQAVAINFRNPAGGLTANQGQGYWYWLELGFWIGAVFFAARLLVQFISLLRIYQKSKSAYLLGHRVRIMTGDGAPFSFWKNIYVNPKLHAPEDLKAILLHEQVHVSEWHTLDILLAEVSTIFYWFNPGIWLMKKAIRENIEFITDREILQKGVDTKQYQYSLVNVSFSGAPQGIVNHFNISTIKKRIIMMNAKKSPKINLTRYAFLVPAVFILLLAFTISKAALVKKSIHLVKPKSTILKLEPLKLKLKPAVFNAPVRVKKTSTKAAMDTVPAEKRSFPITDTGKKNMIILKNNQLTVEPSMYIVDGQLVKDYDISKVDPADIISINVGKSQGDGKIVVYVRTKNGVAQTPLTSIKINGSAAKNFPGQVINGKLAYLDTIKVAGNQIKLDTIAVQKPLSYSISNLSRSNVSTFKVLALQPGATTPAIFNRGQSPSFSLSHLSDKLIIINGKIASQADLKKLSAFDIDRMVLKTDEETKELYGDKAKNGLLFIITKK